MQNFGATIKKHYGMLWYFLEWPIAFTARASRFFCKFLCRHCTSTTSNFLISRFMKDVIKPLQNFLSLSELGHDSWAWFSWSFKLLTQLQESSPTLFCQRM